MIRSTSDSRSSSSQDPDDQALTSGYWLTETAHAVANVDVQCRNTIPLGVTAAVYCFGIPDTGDVDTRVIL